MPEIPSGNFAEAGEEVYASKKLDDVAARHIRRILTQTKGRIHGPGGAADILGINPSTLRNRMNQLRIPYGRKADYS
jgi:DNA-binding NtrC family response regulator